MANLSSRLGWPVTTRNYSLGDLARKAWGAEWAAPDKPVYEFSNGRQFASTDQGITGIYRPR